MTASSLLIGSGSFHAAESDEDDVGIPFPLVRASVDPSDQDALVRLFHSSLQCQRALIECV